MQNSTVWKYILHSGCSCLRKIMFQNGSYSKEFTLMPLCRHFSPIGMNEIPTMQLGRHICVGETFIIPSGVVCIFCACSFIGMLLM